MILPTPIQKNFVELRNSIPLRQTFADYESTFVILHPFYKVKEGYNISLNYYTGANKKEITKACTQISWAQIIKEANLTDIKELERLVSFYYCASRTIDKIGWMKFMNVIHSNNYIVPQTDVYPEILTDLTLEVLKQLGYSDIIIFPFALEERKFYKIQELINSPLKLPASQPRILTPNNKIFFVNDFDDCFTFLSSDKKTIDKIISEIDLEGFYCDDTTKPEWSFERQTGEIIDFFSPERKAMLGSKQ